jgi:hypothetical protein
MNWGALKTTGVWLHALLSAAIMGAADAVLNFVVAGEFHWRVVGGVAAVGAARATFLHLKKSPLPTLTWPDPVNRERGAGAFEVFIWVLGVLVLVFVAYAVGYDRGRAFGFELRLLETAKEITLPPELPRDLPAELDAHFVSTEALVACREALAEQEQQASECGAAIDEAELRGWNTGYGVSRDDWKVQSWECR